MFWTRMTSQVDKPSTSRSSWRERTRSRVPSLPHSSRPRGRRAGGSSSGTPSPTRSCPSRGWLCNKRPSSSWTSWPRGRASTTTASTSCLTATAAATRSTSSASTSESPGGTRAVGRSQTKVNFWTNYVKYLREMNCCKM